MDRIVAGITSGVSFLGLSIAQVVGTDAAANGGLMYWVDRIGISAVIAIVVGIAATKLFGLFVKKTDEQLRDRKDQIKDQKERISILENRIKSLESENTGLHTEVRSLYKQIAELNDEDKEKL